MAKNKRNPNIKNAQMGSDEAYVSWEGNKQQQRAAFKAYADALEAGNVDHSATAHNRRNFEGLTTYAGGRPGFRSSDFDWFRPGQAAPTKPKDIIAFGRYVYRRVDLIHNAIDLMGDFACHGIRLVHKNKRVENFYNDWFKEVGGKRVTERLSHLLFREANVPLRFYTIKLNKVKRAEMQKTVAEEDLKLEKDNDFFKKSEIPWRYNFIDPLLVEPVGGSLTTLSNKKVLLLKIPTKLRQDIKKLQSQLANSDNPAIQKVLNDISPDILEAVSKGTDIVLPPEKTRMYHYKKDDWQTWADPMTYCAFEPLNLYQRLQLADKAAIDGATNQIRVWKIGSLEHKLAPTPTASATLADMLGANVGGGTIDIVWGPDIELLETSPDVLKGLGEEKYRPTLMAIYAALGIPPTLTGTFGASGTTNNFISLKTLVERLNYVRSIVIEFWTEQIKMVQKAMGFRLPAQIEFNEMYLEDPASMATLLLNMADRNILSEEFVQRHVKAKPDIENRRIKQENKVRENQGEEKVSPYHQVNKDHDLKKLALQTGAVAPSQVGLELEDLKEGEESLMDQKTKQMKEARPPMSGNKPPGGGGQGRPKNSKDTKPRKPREFKPKTKAVVEIWAKNAQLRISEAINPVMLDHFGKSSLRGLTSAELNELEEAKFEILCNLNMTDNLTHELIARAAINPPIKVHNEFGEWIDDAKEFLGDKLTIDQIRDLRASYYVHYKYGDIK